MRFMASLARRRAMGLLVARSAARARASSSSRSRGTTARTDPSRYSSWASTRSPVKYISRAL